MSAIAGIRTIRLCHSTGTALCQPQLRPYLARCPFCVAASNGRKNIAPNSEFAYNTSFDPWIWLNTLNLYS